MKTLIIQKNINDTDYERYLKLAESREAGLVAFGELAVSGCLYRRRDPDSFDDILRTLGRYRMRVLLGLPRLDGERLHNSYVYFHGGDYQVYNKINLFEPMNEIKVYEKGTEPGLFDTDFGRLGVAICYDIRFDEVFAKLSNEGADYFFVPAAFPRVRISDWKRLLVQRAVDHNTPVIGINSVGDDGANEFGGSSMMVAPGGKILSRADETSETMLEVEL